MRHRPKLQPTALASVYFPLISFSVIRWGSAGCFPLPVLSDSIEAAPITYRAFRDIDKSSDLLKTTKPSFL